MISAPSTIEAIVFTSPHPQVAGLLEAEDDQAHPEREENGAADVQRRRRGVVLGLAIGASGRTRRSPRAR